MSRIPFVQSGSYPVREGNLVQPWIDGVPAFRRICEAIEAAERSVWVTVTFLWSDFEMPDGRGSALEVLDRAAARGVDVRIIFWRPDSALNQYTRNTFWGSAEQVALLDERGSGVKIRWDRAHPGFCQHQKSWLIDAGAESETAFVGGINLNPHSMASPGHDGAGQNHDAYVELGGPSVVDVHHNFVQRWNEASERLAPGGRWGVGSEFDLVFPTRIPGARGHAVAQVQRTIHSGRYTDGRPAPGAATFDIASGERANFDQYCLAIDAASRSIYIENQYVEVSEIAERLHRALVRGVEVLVVVPTEPDRTSMSPARAALGQHEKFLLAGLAGLGSDGQRKDVYVHDKLMLIDDEWATVGSCNLHEYSLFGNSELNVAFNDPATVRALRSALFLEHLGCDTSDMDDRSALRLFHRIAIENRQRRDRNDHQWQGLAVRIDVETYAT